MKAPTARADCGTNCKVLGKAWAAVCFITAAVLNFFSGTASPSRAILRSGKRVWGTGEGDEGGRRGGGEAPREVERERVADRLPADVTRFFRTTTRFPAAPPRPRGPDGPDRDPDARRVRRRRTFRGRLDEPAEVETADPLGRSAVDALRSSKCSSLRIDRNSGGMGEGDARAVVPLPPEGAGLFRTRGMPRVAGAARADRT